MTDIRYPGVKAGILNWPVSAVRLVGRSSQQMQNVANNILSVWRSYTDESVGILAETDGTPHNTVTPILHYDETEGYILDLALRNNRTSEEYPDGIFHPHREYHNIKKENIGLIEVMGLAILPARLKDQGAQIAEILAGQRPNTSREAGDTLAVHADWIDELIAKYGTHMKPQDANKAVKAEIGTVFSHVLENAGVFKQDAAGQAPLSGSCRAWALRRRKSHKKQGHRPARPVSLFCCCLVAGRLPPAAFRETAVCRTHPAERQDRSLQSTRYRHPVGGVLTPPCGFPASACLPYARGPGMPGPYRAAFSSYPHSHSTPQSSFLIYPASYRARFTSMTRCFTFTQQSNVKLTAAAKMASFAAGIGLNTRTSASTAQTASTNRHHAAVNRRGVRAQSVT